MDKTIEQFLRVVFGVPEPRSLESWIINHSAVQPNGNRIVPVVVMTSNE